MHIELIHAAKTTGWFRKKKWNTIMISVELDEIEIAKAKVFGVWDRWFYEHDELPRDDWLYSYNSYKRHICLNELPVEVTFETLSDALVAEKEIYAGLVNIRRWLIQEIDENRVIDRYYRPDPPFN